MEKVYFPMKYYRLTQGYGSKSSSHKNILAIDVGGKDTGRDDIFAPFTGIIKKKYVKKGVANTIWFESIDKVKCANGEETYLTMLLAHDDNIDDLKVGQKILQGQKFMEEGRSGNATGNHLHIELSNKKFYNKGWNQNKYGDWQINSAVKPEEYMFLRNDQVVLNDVYKNTKYELKKDSSFTYNIIEKLNNCEIVFNNYLDENSYNKAKESIKKWIS